MMKRSSLLWIFAGLSLVSIILAWAWLRAPLTIHASIAENGGFTPADIQARVGEPLRLRLVSDDVEHTFALGQNSMKPVLLKPGQPVDITLTFEKPGTYTFYSTTFSSINFWRMRGTIEVAGDEPTPAPEPPLYVRLGLNLDDEHESMGAEMSASWSRKPSAKRGAAFEDLIPALYLTRDFYVSHSPLETFEKLRAEKTAVGSLDENDTWDVVALIWQKNSTPDVLGKGEQLYQDNCAACHGKTGAGDGQFANEMKALGEKNQDKHGIQVPTDFTKPEHLLEAKTAIVQGKTLRGGMGTGMPMWGSIFTNDQLWDVVAYLYTFQFDYSK